MPTFNIANEKIQGVDVVIIILDSSFETKNKQGQDEIISEFQKRAIASGFRGEVVPIWDGGGGRIHFKAPLQLHPFFSTITQRYIADHFNKQLSW